MSILRNKMIAEDIENHYPNARLVSFDDKDSFLQFYDADELREVDGDWFPLCCYYDKQKEKTVYGGTNGIIHTYTNGETGAGKTTRYVMQSIRALSSLKNKPSMLITDQHGEIIENLYCHLIENGYEIRIINCDDPKRSDTYNPLYEMAENCLHNRAIDNETHKRIRNLSEIIQPIESNNDPIWDRGARAYTNGCILDKFEDLVDGKIPKECMTIYNIIQNHYWLRSKLGEGYAQSDIFKIPHYNQKGKNAISVQKIISVTNNAEKTKASYFGVVENHYDNFGQPSMYALSSNNTVNVSDFFDKPTVIVIQSGSTQIGDDLISLLVNDIYTKAVTKGRERKDKRLPRNIHCFIDEFANCNIADGKEFIKMLTTSRKFGMFWHMILQCDAQLDRKFDPNTAQIIRSNSTELFMGSQDFNTSMRFAQSCGSRTIESVGSRLAQGNPHLEVISLITAEKLSLISPGCIYVKVNKRPLLKTYIESYYNCPDFPSVDQGTDIYPHNNFDYTETAFYPDDIPDYELRAGRFNVRHSVETDEICAGQRETGGKAFEPLFERAGNRNPIYRDFRKHLVRFQDYYVENAISGLTIIPKRIRTLIRVLYGNAEASEFKRLVLPRNMNTLKFDIIEEFIANHNFKRKNDWERTLLAEYDCLKKSDVFPDSIMIAYQDAINEFHELTLTSIKEIKKIVEED